MAALKHSAEQSRRNVEQAGVRCWPVVINVNRTSSAYGVVTGQFHADGADFAFVGVGAKLNYADIVVETPQGPAVTEGIATSLLNLTRNNVLRMAA